MPPRTPTVDPIEKQFFDAIGRVSAAGQYDPKTVLELIGREFDNFRYNVPDNSRVNGVRTVRANVVDDQTKRELLSLIFLLDSARAEGKPIRLEDMAVPLAQIAAITSRKLQNSLAAHKYPTPTNEDELAETDAKVDRMYDRHFKTVYPRQRQG